MTTRGGAIEQGSPTGFPTVGGESIHAQAQDVIFSAEFYIPWVILKVRLANHPYTAANRKIHLRQAGKTLFNVPQSWFEDSDEFAAKYNFPTTNNGIDPGTCNPNPIVITDTDDVGMTLFLSSLRSW